VTYGLQQEKVSVSAQNRNAHGAQRRKKHWNATEALSMWKVHAVNIPRNLAPFLWRILCAARGVIADAAGWVGVTAGAVTVIIVVSVTVTTSSSLNDDVGAAPGRPGSVEILVEAGAAAKEEDAPVLDVGAAPGRPERVGTWISTELEMAALPLGTGIATMLDEATALVADGVTLKTGEALLAAGGAVLAEGCAALVTGGAGAPPVGAGVSAPEPPFGRPEKTGPISRFEGKSVKSAVRDAQSDTAVDTASCWSMANFFNCDSSSAAMATLADVTSTSMQVL
jgi:hypothetical protein